MFEVNDFRCVLQIIHIQQSEWETFRCPKDSYIPNLLLESSAYRERKPETPHFIYVRRIE